MQIAECAIEPTTPGSGYAVRTLVEQWRVGRPVRESAEAKGRRYITEGRLLLRAVDPSEIVASCRGNGAIYRVGYQLV